MHNIKTLFEKIQHKNPNWSTLMCFNMTIYWKDYPKNMIRRLLKTLVDVNDYEWVPLEKMIESCLLVTGSPSEIPLTKTEK